ncbi:MAG TPA: hypothetical protein DEP36_01100 [Gammaproteobacteria bacterium]|nr:BrnA antitoxin family protein [Gammaproteobacteria bacterium]HCB12156.1 hypothetical protein [Gammaproteobacteria bacterium]
MRDEYDFSGATVAQDVPELARLQSEGNADKIRISLYVEVEVLAAFRARARAEGQSYQALMSAALRQSIMPESAPVTLGDLRRVLHEELHPVSA